MSRTGKTIITLTLALVLLPFVLQTDLYPLFRFGMFAEPVKREVQTENFALRIIDHAGNQRIMPPAEMRLGSLAYLMRNYYYRNQTDILLARLQGIRQKQRQTPIREWQLLRVTSKVAVYRPDTVVVARLEVQTSKTASPHE